MRFFDGSTFSLNCWPIFGMRFLVGSGFSVNCWPIAGMHISAGSIQCKLVPLLQLGV